MLQCQDRVYALAVEAVTALQFPRPRGPVVAHGRMSTLALPPAPSSHSPTIPNELLNRPGLTGELVYLAWGIHAPVCYDKATTARKLRQRIRAVMECAASMDLRPDSPCDRIGPVLGAQGNVVRHMRVSSHGEVASAIKTAWASNVRPVVKLTFEFLVDGDALRPGPRGGGRSTRGKGVWTISDPRTRGIASTGFPLCRRALEILKEACALGARQPAPGAARCA